MQAPLIIIIGHYGSGKSEFSVNLALQKHVTIMFACGFGYRKSVFSFREAREI